LDKRLLERMLRLQEMRVVSFDVDFDENILHVKLAWRQERTSCVCGAKGSSSPVKSEPRKHPVRHLDCFEFKTLLYFDCVEMKCGECGRLFNRRPSFLGESHYVTLSVLEDWLQKLEAVSPKQVAEWYGEKPRTFQDFYYGHLARADRERELPQIRRLGIDEISMQKGHKYVLLLYDLDNHGVVEVLPNRLKETLVTFLREHEEDMFAELQVACTDMWPKYKDAVQQVFPHVKVVVDRFHVIQQMNEAIDDRRREVQRTLADEEGRRHCKKELRFALLRARETQLKREDGAAELKEALRLDRELRRLYFLKEDLRRIYTETEPDEAAKRLNNWLRRAAYLGSKHLSSFLKTVKKWRTEILAFTENQVTNGVPEGMNCKAKLVKRISFGFRNFANFRLRILHTCGDSLCCSA